MTKISQCTPLQKNLTSKKFAFGIPSHSSKLGGNKPQVYPNELSYLLSRTYSVAAVAVSRLLLVQLRAVAAQKYCHCLAVLLLARFYEQAYLVTYLSGYQQLYLGAATVVQPPKVTRCCAFATASAAVANPKWWLSVYVSHAFTPPPFRLLLCFRW